MDFKAIGNTLVGAGRTVCIRISRHGPEILTVAGCIGAVAAAGLACRATLKVNEVLDGTNADLDSIHGLHEKIKDDPDCAEAKKYSEKDYKSDLVIAYFNAGKKLALLYGPAILAGAASFACIFAGQRILKARYSASVAACLTTEKLFSEYRKRVVEDRGEAEDLKYRYGITANEIIKAELDKKGNPKTDKDGKPKTKAEIINSVNARDINDNDFSRVFEECSTKMWDRSAEYNKNWLLIQQTIANQLLQSRGYLFLNEVYAMLGFPVTEAGQDVGWLYLKDNKNGDNYVNFRMEDVCAANETRLERMTDYNNAILLNFNVDGYIKSRLFEAQRVFD